MWRRGRGRWLRASSRGAVFRAGQGRLDGPEVQKTAPHSLINFITPHPLVPLAPLLSVPRIPSEMHLAFGLDPPDG